MKKYLLLILLIMAMLCACSSENAEENFIGLNESEIDYEFSPQINKKSFNYQMFCYDNDGNVYFSNPKDACKLYVYDGVGSKPLTDCTAYGLNFVDGKIYFLSDNINVNIEDRVYPEGYPFEYDIKTGEQRQIGKSLLCGLTVMDNEFFVLDMSGDCTVCRYDMSHDTTAPLYNSFNIRKYRSYYLTFEEKSEDKLNFYLESNNEKLLLIDDDLPLYDNFFNGKYYYISSNTQNLNVIDLQNGDRQTIGVDITDFTFLGDELYVIKDDLFLYKYNGETLNIADNTSQYLCIYSDNKNLFGIKTDYSESARSIEYSFAKIYSDFTTEIIG